VREVLEKGLDGGRVLSAIISVTVSRGELVYSCGMGRHGWLCGCCGRGDLGPNPMVGSCCKECGARIEEAIPQKAARC